MSQNPIVHNAHPEGRTYIAFSRDGSYVYTGGCDSLVRIWNVSEIAPDYEPDVVLDDNIDEPITAVAVDANGWLSGSEDSHVRKYKNGSRDMESLVTRTNGAPIRYISADAEGRRVAVTSDELVVKVIDLDDTTRIKLLSGHRRGVRSATWHPSGTLLTTCGADGRIIVWDLTEDQPKVEKTFEGIIPTLTDTGSVEYSYGCAALWHPSGQYFIIATKAHEIIKISRDTWLPIGTFSDPDSLGAVTAMALSVNGVYLASACSSNITIWSTQDRRVISRQPIASDVIIHQLAFSPKDNVLAWTDSTGAHTRWPGVIPSSFPSPTKQTPLTGVPVPLRRSPTPLFGQDNDAPGENDVAYPVDIDLEERDEDWIIDDLDGGMIDKEDKEFGPGGTREIVSVTKAQPAFQPGSTPFQNRRKYLSFNNIGVVEVVDQDTHNIVNVEFHDQSTRKNYHFSDHFKYDLAAVGERGIVYACPPENDHLAQITYKPYSTWAAHGEWSYHLPKGERAIAVAAGGTTPTKSLRTLKEADIEGNGYVAVATNKGIIRFFSGGGIQRGPIWAVDGDIVAMVAARDYVFVVHREGGTSLDGNQNLKYTLRTSDTFRVMHTGRLPINKNHILKWIGISDEGAPVIYDSLERVMMLEHYRFTSQGSWALMLDTSTLERRTGKDESYWPIGVTNNTLMCIILKGREEHPGFPRPLAQEIDMHLPYLNMESTEVQKEERFARETILLDHIRDSLDDELTTDEIQKAELTLDKEIILLIQLACKQDKLQRALDAVKLLHHTATLDSAAKVADFYHLTGLREKIDILKSVRLETDRLRDDRDKRRGWRNAAGPVLSVHEPHMSYAHRSDNPFKNVQPAPSIHRPSLTSAAPSAEPSPFSRRRVDQSETEHSAHNYAKASPPPEKRKRDALDNDNERKASPDDTSKRRVVDKFASHSDGHPKPNPFAKKPAQVESTTTKVNPFQKKLTSNKSLHKSDSFFDKVNAAENEIESNKRKITTKKPPTKQTTLFGFPAGSGAKSSQHKNQSQDSARTFDSQDEQETQILSIDAHMDDDYSMPTTEASQTDESQEITQTEGLIEDEGEPIEWPATPPPEPITAEAS